MFWPQNSTVQRSSSVPRVTRPFTVVKASCILNGERSEPVLYSDMYLPARLKPARRPLPMLRSKLIDSEAEYSGANDGREPGSSEAAGKLFGSTRSAAVKTPYWASV